MVPFFNAFIIIMLLIGISSWKYKSPNSIILSIILLCSLSINIIDIYSNKKNYTIKSQYSKKYINNVNKILNDFNHNILIGSNRKLITEDTEDYIAKRKLLEHKREFTLAGTDVEISTSPLLAIKGYQHEIDLNCPPIYKQDAPSIFCNQSITGDIDYNVSLEIYQTRLYQLIRSGLRIFVDHVNSTFEVPTDWIEEKIIDLKSGEILYLLKPIEKI